MGPRVVNFICLFNSNKLRKARLKEAVTRVQEIHGAARFLEVDSLEFGWQCLFCFWLGVEGRWPM